MHELSIAQSILDIALQEKQKAGADSIFEMELEIGKLAGVEYKSFDFAMKTVLESSGLGSTNVIIHKPDGKAVCESCGLEFGIQSFETQCRSCGSYKCNIKQGKELRLISIIVE